MTVGRTVRIAALTALFTSGVIGPAAARGLSVSNPPPLAKPVFTVTVSGATGTLRAYLSTQRTSGKGATSLGRVAVRHGKVRIKLPRLLRAGGYYVVVCGLARHAPCTASKKPVVVVPAVPAHPSLGVSGSATPAGGAATGSIGSSGGALVATSPGGSKLVLLVPARSLPDGTTVSMTPVSALSAPGAGTFIAGAQIDAGGQNFVRGGVLLVQPAHPVALRDRAAVTWSGTGQDLHSVPLAAVSAQIAIPVAGTGGYALMSGHGQIAAHDLPTGPAAHLAAASAPPGGLSGLYDSVLGGMTQDLVANGHVMGDGSPEASAYAAAVQRVLDEWHADLVNVELPAGLQDDDAANTAMLDFIAWGREGALTLGDGRAISSSVYHFSVKYDGMSKAYGGPNWEETRIFPYLQQLLAGIYNRAQQRCASQHDLSRVATAVSAYRSDLILGHPDSISLDQLYACEQFTVSFDSRMNESIAGPGGDSTGKYVHEYTANVTIKLDANLQHLVGSQTGTYTQASGEVVHKPTNCGLDGQPGINKQTESGGNGDTFQVLDFTIPNRVGVVPVLTFNVHSPTETYIEHIDHADGTPSACDGPFLPMPVKIGYWFDDWDAQHKSQAVQNTLAEYAISLTPGSGANFGSISYTDVPFTRGDATCTENTTISVTHTPAPFTRL